MLILCHLILLITLFPTLNYPATNMPCDNYWTEIKVLESKRVDVHQILNQSVEKSVFERYKIKEGTLDISYSYGKCQDSSNSGWNVLEDVVTELDFTPDNEIKFSSLNIDRNKFKKVHEFPETPQMTTYLNDKDGIKYVVQADGTLDSISYYPSEKYQYLRCESNER